MSTRHQKCEICNGNNAEIVGGKYGTKDFQRFCKDCWETIKFDYEEHKKEVSKYPPRARGDTRKGRHDELQNQTSG